LSVRVPGAASPPLRRLPLEARLVEADEAIESGAAASQLDLVTPPFDWARETTRRIGTIAHRFLARIADQGLEAWPAARIDALAPRVRADLASFGFTSDELPKATERVLDAVRRTLADARGRWLFDARHADARSEWAIAGVDGGAVVHVVVDRTFVADGVRWIVDFKTGSHEGGDVAAFLDSEVERYRGQLERYGRLMCGLDARPIRLALYYPFVEGGFREIQAAAPSVPAPRGEQLALFGPAS
jgi:ATP-dependent helicase/nuclease subunit A